MSGNPAVKFLATNPLAKQSFLAAIIAIAAWPAYAGDREEKMRAAYRCQVDPVDCTRLQQDYIEHLYQQREPADEIDAASGMVVPYNIAEYYASLRDAALGDGWPTVIPMPLPEHDHPFKGTVHETRGDAEAMGRLCPKTMTPVTIGCAKFQGSYCWIFIASDEILKASGWPYEIIRRHEEGHCNGFPANHILARYFVRTPASETTRKWLAE